MQLVSGSGSMRLAGGYHPGRDNELEPPRHLPVGDMIYVPTRNAVPCLRRQAITGSAEKTSLPIRSKAL